MMLTAKQIATGLVTQAMAERDAAIKRGVAVWKGAEQQRGMLLLLLWMRTAEHDDDHEALDRAEAKEGVECVWWCGCGGAVW